MRYFWAGVILGIVLLLLAGYTYLLLGGMSARADRPPGNLESYLALMAREATLRREASPASNPYPETDENLTDGMNVYVSNCANCHGTLDKRKSDFGLALNPPAPQFLFQPVGLSEQYLHFITKHGIRWSGMPAWGKILSDRSIWEVSAFLARLQKLPPALKQQMPSPAS